MLIGVLGGGQLGRMLGLAGLPLGHRFRFWEPADTCPAAAVGEWFREPWDAPGAAERFVRGSGTPHDRLDAVTLEFENVPASVVRALETLATPEAALNHASAHTSTQTLPATAHRPAFAVAPSSKALGIGQDRIHEKQAFERSGFSVHPYRACDSIADLRAAGESLGYPLVIKTRRGGYDGKGQTIAKNADDLSRAFHDLNGESRPLLAEQFVPFDAECSIIATRAHDGSFVAYPLTQNVHRSGILVRSDAPAASASPTVFTDALQAQAEKHAQHLMADLGYVGTLAIEFFVQRTPAGIRLLANEFAPRVHNSGHWTIEGAACSQFENHIRAVTGSPLGSTRVAAPVVMLNLIGQWPKEHAMLAVPHTHLHLYGKEPRVGRKVGHVTITGPDAIHHATQIEKLISKQG